MADKSTSAGSVLLMLLGVGAAAGAIWLVVRDARSLNAPPPKPKGYYGNPRPRKLGSAR